MVTSDGIVDGNRINDKSGNVPRTRSKFTDSLSHVFPNSNRFGELAPFFCMEGVPSDSIKLLSSQKVDSFTLKAPLMQDIKLCKDLFLVPRQAILPLNWEKFITNPVIGEDVPDNCGTTVEEFWSKVFTLLNDWQTYINDTIPDDPEAEDYEANYRETVKQIFMFMAVAEYFLSNGSLLASLNCHGSKYIKFISAGETISCDKWFDKMMSKCSGELLPISYDGYHLLVSIDGEARLADDVGMTWREFLDLLRDNPKFFGMNSPDDDSESVATDFAEFVDEFTSWGISPLYVDEPLDLARPLAYQIVAAHFYTNDHVDYIYTADLYRSYIFNLVEQYVFSGKLPTFTCNGVKYNYDYLSAKIFEEVLSYTHSAYANDSAWDETFIPYLAAIFSYKHSLRFVDYFVGSKTRPLAIGDTSVAVNANKASVVDITRQVQVQRFLNAVNRVGRKIADYTKMMVGIDMSVDYHNPLWIGSTQDIIYGDRSEYTGSVEDAAQNNISALLKSSGGRYEFQFGCDRDCIVIGIQYYDIHRVYSESVDRHYFHENRYDFFNPFMQFIGDQTVYQSELTTGGSTPFGYQTRHMEYKQMYDYCAGAFVENLPAWIFKAERGFRKYEKTQSPTFIRSYPSEFDQFYVSLTGWSLGSYFHFIVENINLLDASRPMAKTPDILQ